MKIYFAASIRGGRQDVGVYKQLIDYLKQDNQVLTEHIADINLTANGQRQISDETIRNRDVNWLKEADLVIAETSHPSLGVGYELATAEQLGKPVVILHNPEKSKLSAMIVGTKYFKDIYYYHDVNDAIMFLKSFVSPK